MCLDLKSVCNYFYKAGFMLFYIYISLNRSLLPKKYFFLQKKNLWRLFEYYDELELKGNTSEIEKSHHHNLET